MSEYPVDVSILPELLPVVDGVLAAGDQFAAAWEQLAPHLTGAFGSLAANWANATPAQREALLARGPRLRHAMALFARLRPLMDAVPDLEA